jgi:hypothetical protein
MQGGKIFRFKFGKIYHQKQAITAILMFENLNIIKPLIGHCSLSYANTFIYTYI